MPQFTLRSESAHVRRLTFANPPVNLVDAATVQELLGVVDTLTADEDVKVVVVDSATPDYFLNHADLAGMGELLPATQPDGTPTWIELVTKITHAPFVTIGAIRGRTRGGGDELALALDLRYASLEKAFFGQPEVAIGLVPGGGGSDRLPRLVGRDRALEVILSGEDYDATRAERYGWVTRALPDAELDAFVDALAARLALFDRDSIVGAKTQINRATLPPAEDLRTSWSEVNASARWPGFQGRIPQFGQAIEQLGLDEMELHLGRYVGLGGQG